MTARVYNGSHSGGRNFRWNWSDGPEGMSATFGPSYAPTWSIQDVGSSVHHPAFEVTRGHILQMGKNERPRRFKSLENAKRWCEKREREARTVSP